MIRSSGTVFQRCGAALCVAVLAFGLAGCGNVNGLSRQISALRIVDASSGAGGLDFYANTTALTYNVGFGAVSSYIVFAPGTYTLSAQQAGTSTVLSSTRGSLLQNVQYTLLVGNVAAGLQTLLLPDQSAPAPSGQIALRFIDQATRIGAVDIYLVAQGGTFATSLPVMTGLTLNNAANAPHYINVPNGSYSLVVVPTGTVPAATTVASYTGSVVTYPVGSARTFILLDPQLTTIPGIQVVTASDYDSAVATF